MTLSVRTITADESDVLDQWQRADNVVCYRRARIVRLSADGWKAADIADVLGLHVEVVRQAIKDFNQGGIPAITPRPRSGGRPGSRPIPRK
jgi:transposase